MPLAYGIHKLQISCVVEDEKVSVDWLQENIESIEDYVSTVTTLGRQWCLLWHTSLVRQDKNFTVQRDFSPCSGTDVM